MSWVIDGDSLEIETSNGELEVRLAGINAAERGECYFDESLDFLIETIKGREVIVDVVSEDQFGRTLANVWLDEELVSLGMVVEGLAIAQSPDGANPLAESLIQAEEAAYEARIGLWSETACGGSAAVPAIRIDLDESVFDPSGPDDAVIEEEQITLVNDTITVIDLRGWTLRDESSRNRLVFPEGTTLEPGASLRISSGCSTSPAWCSGAPIWNNDGDMALLLDPLGTVVARARYQASSR